MNASTSSQPHLAYNQQGGMAPQIPQQSQQIPQVPSPMQPVPQIQQMPQFQQQPQQPQPMPQPMPQQQQFQQQPQQQVPQQQLQQFNQQPQQQMPMPQILQQQQQPQQQQVPQQQLPQNNQGENLFAALSKNTQQTQQQNVFGQMQNQQMGFEQYLKQVQIPNGIDNAQAYQVAQKSFADGLTAVQATQALQQPQTQTDNNVEKITQDLDSAKKILSFAWGQEFNNNVTKIANYLHQQSGGDKNSYSEVLANTLRNPVQAKIVLGIIEGQGQNVQQGQQPQQGGNLPSSHDMTTGQQSQSTIQQTEQALLNEWRNLKYNTNSPLNPLSPIKDPEQAKAAQQRKEQIEIKLLELEQSKNQQRFY